MPASPQNIKITDRFPQRFSFNDLTGPLNESNTSFHFQENARLLAFIFKSSQDSYKNAVKLIRKYKGSEEFEFEDPIIIIPTSREIRVEFTGAGFPIKQCDILYVECDLVATESVILEVSKWVLG